MAFMILLRYRVRMLRVSGCGGSSPPFSLPHLVCLLVLLETLLTRSTHRLESIVPHTALSTSLGVPLWNFLDSGTDPSLDCPHYLTLIKAGFYSTVTHQGCVFRVILRNPSENVSL